MGPDSQKLKKESHKPPEHKIESQPENYVISLTLQFHVKGLLASFSWADGTSLLPSQISGAIATHLYFVRPITSLLLLV